MNAVFFIVHISGRKSVYHSCIMMYENIIVDDSTIIYNNYACQPLIIFIFCCCLWHCLGCTLSYMCNSSWANSAFYEPYVSIIIRVFFIVSTINFINMCTIGLPYKKKNQDASLLENNKKYLHSILFSHTFCYVLKSLNSCKKDNPIRGIFL